MIKTYKIAYHEINPAFISLTEKTSKKPNIIPYSINKTKWQDESKVRAVSAWSNSIFTIKLWWWNKTFGPENVF